MSGKEQEAKAKTVEDIREMKISFETFTVAQAIEIVKKMGKNRELRPSVVQQYLREMDSVPSGWRDKDRGSAVIMFDRAGFFRAGQHRMTALSLCKNRESCTFLTVRDATEEEIARQDGGANRTFNDRVVMFCDTPKFNKLTSSKVTAICRLLVESDNIKATPENVAEKSRDNIQALSELDNLITKDGRVLRSAPMMAACVFAFPRMESSKWFEAVEQLDQGVNVVVHSPIHKLRTYTDGKAATRRPAELFLKSLQAFKSLHTNEGIGNLTASPRHLLGW